ncbi:MAG: histidine--tRNA ligase [Hyphomonadaceae bacterium JAD_PAG50586_4]|nr:MAG: histidine--tRNA ligase [Hyphomonadaceae bacterium JAD_PAG50586_4]
MSDEAAPRPKPRRARGLMDRRGPGLALERGLIARIAKVYETWGFEPLETPAFEYADALGKFLPDQDRPNEGVFALQDDDDQWLALRYDLTAPLARFVAENFDALPKPYRRWAAGPVWRNEKPGPGRFREFWQCDADTVGAASPAADAEMIAVACAGLEAAGVQRGGYQVKFSTRKLLDAVLENIGVAAGAYSTRLVVLRAIDKFDRLGRQGVELLLGDGRKDESGDFTKGAGLDAKQRSAVIDLVTAGAGARGDVLARLAKIAGETAIAELREIDASLSALGVDDAGAAIDPTIVRGLEYYTGAVFEAQLIGAGGANFGSVGGGGRYDDLVSRFRGERIPATGFSIGVSRLAAALQVQAAAKPDGPVVVLVMDQARVADALGMAAELRAAGVRAEAYLGGAGMKAQLKYADKRAAPVAVIQGGDELAKGVVTLKDLKLGAKIASELGEDREAYARAREKVQIEAPRGQLVEAVKSMLG